MDKLIVILALGAGVLVLLAVATLLGILLVVTSSSARKREEELLDRLAADDFGKYHLARLENSRSPIADRRGLNGAERPPLGPSPEGEQIVGQAIGTPAADFR
jgi:hypothetical protein